MPKINKKSEEIFRNQRSLSNKQGNKLKNALVTKFDELYFDAKRKNSLKAKKIDMETFDQECTFKPKLNNNFKNQSSTQVLRNDFHGSLTGDVKDFPMKYFKKKPFYTKQM